MAKKNELLHKYCTCYFFDDLTKVNDFDLDNTLLDKTFVTLHITLESVPLQMIFDKVDGYIRKYDKNI